MNEVTSINHSYLACKIQSCSTFLDITDNLLLLLLSVYIKYVHYVSCINAINFNNRFMLEIGKQFHEHNFFFQFLIKKFFKTLVIFVFHCQIGHINIKCFFYTYWCLMTIIYCLCSPYFASLYDIFATLPICTKAHIAHSRR